MRWLDMFFITEGLVLVNKKNNHDILNNFFLDFLIIKKIFEEKSFVRDLGKFHSLLYVWLKKVLKM